MTLHHMHDCHNAWLPIFPPTGGACEVPAAIARALMEGVGVMWRRVEVKNWGVSGAWDHVEEGGSEELGRLKTTFAPPVLLGMDGRLGGWGRGRRSDLGVSCSV